VNTIELFHHVIQIHARKRSGHLGVQLVHTRY